MIFNALNTFIPWHRLPALIGAFNIHALRLSLQEKNLYHPTLDGQEGTKASEPPSPDSRMFRRSDGQFNDLCCPMMGAAGTRFGRNFPLEDVHPEPAPDLYEPSPRVVSERLLARKTFKEVETLNLLAAAWIQFQVHDWFSHGDNANVADDPLKIVLKKGDPWPNHPMQIRRTRGDDTRTRGEDRAGLPPTSINTVSHWWDASGIYGSDSTTTSGLRSHVDGKLRTNGRRLPIDSVTNIASTGFSTNWWIGLELLHTLFALEHNAICKELHKNTGWSDERLFQTARLINAALIAKIHMVDWTPAVLAHPTLRFGMKAIWWGLAGERLAKLFGRLGSGDLLSGIPGSRRDHYDVPFSLTEEFVSVYRMHSLLPDEIAFRRLATGKTKVLSMNDVLRERSYGVIDDKNLTVTDALYSFGIAHSGALVLQNFPNFLRRLEVPPDSNGPKDLVDLAAIDVLRDRERGVPRYNRFRRLLRLKPVNSFEELTDNTEWAKELRDIYKDVERVDLLVGTLAETPPKGFGFGETAFRIFILMATRRIKSDRFFTDDYTPQIYTQIGLDWIGNNDMSSVLVRHFPELKPALRGKRNAFEPWKVLH